MLAFIIGILLVLLGIGALVYSQGLPQASERRGARGLAVVLLLLGVFVVAWDSFTIVPARNVGIVNTFGNAGQALDNGFHVVAPWSSVETIDATVQNINLSSDAHNCITVRLANQTTACVDVTVQWNIDQHANANELWQRYRGNNDDVVHNVGSNVVERELRRSLNVVFESYNPLAVLSGAAPTIKTDDLATKALNEIRTHVDTGIVVDTVRIPLVHFDDVTQAKLNGYAQALADTQIATQQKLTAEQQKLANQELAVAASNDPGVLYQNCLNLVKDLAARASSRTFPPPSTVGTRRTR
jgi:regulator of protease activity HflC (stomatin/prohibitin superfamily)